MRMLERKVLVVKRVVPEDTRATRSIAIQKIATLNHEIRNLCRG